MHKRRAMYIPPMLSLAACFFQDVQGLYKSLCDQTLFKDFDKVQFLAFNIFTLPGLCENSSSPCYIGDRVTAHDLSRRVSVLSHAMAAAAAHADQDTRTLKIFAAPEFFFRGAFGAYDATSWAHARYNLSAMLENLTSTPPFNEWLVVCGTIVAVHDEGNASKSAFYNAAPIYSRGRKLIAFKKYISPQDFTNVVGTKGVPNPATVCGQDDPLLPCLYSPSQMWMLRHFGFEDYTLVNYTFEVLNVRIGLEICLDHKAGLLSKHLGRHNFVDFHLIVSGGMIIEDGPVGTRQNGVCCLVDGDSKSQVNRNWYGRGRHVKDWKNVQWYGKTYKEPSYDVGPVFERSIMSNLEAHIWGDGSVSGTSGAGAMQYGPSCQPYPLKRTALLEDWDTLLFGIFPTHPYNIANDLHNLVRSNSLRQTCGPTIDAYWPIVL